MSLFNKKTCPICEQTLKKPMLKIKDNLKICKSCSLKLDIDHSMLPFQSVDDIKEHLIYREENLTKFNAFKPTREIKVTSATFRIDDANKQWYWFWSKTPNNPTIYSFSDIINYEIIENGETVSTGGVGSAVAGGLLFGGTGAIVGSVVGKNNSTNITNMTLRISLNNKYRTSIVIQTVPIGSNCKVGSFLYNTYKQTANEISSILDYMCEQCHQPSMSETIALNSTSDADEIRKFKELLDSGIITEKEFEAKKKQLLHIDDDDCDIVTETLDDIIEKVIQTSQHDDDPELVRDRHKEPTLDDDLER